MGDNYWPYGIDANRKVLEALFQYSYEQGAVFGVKPPDGAFNANPGAPTNDRAVSLPIVRPP